MNKSNLMAMTSMTPMERAAGRYMRGPDHPGAESGGGGNNQGGEEGGNSGAQTNDSEKQNNSGQEFDPASFWNSSPGESNGSPSGGSAESKPKSGDNPPKESEGLTFAKTFSTQLDSLKFGDGTFSEKTMAELGEGKLEGINSALHGQLKESTRQSVVMAATLMQEYGKVLMSQVQEAIQSHLGNRDNQASLGESIQSYKDPALRPMIDSIFTQAMKNTGGDRTKAVEMTKGMLKVMGQSGAADMGFDPESRNKEQGTVSENAKSLVDQLLSRS